MRQPALRFHPAFLYQSGGSGGVVWGGGGRGVRHSEQLQRRRRNTVSDSVLGHAALLHHLLLRRIFQRVSSPSAASLWTLTGAEWPLQNCHIAGATQAEAEATLSLEHNCFLSCAFCDQAADRAEQH